MINRIIKFNYLIILLIVSNASYAQNAKKTALFTVDDTHIYPEEFKYVYKKNNLNKEQISTTKDINEYLNLFVNFKLKVMEARDLGYDTLKTYREELAKYEEQLIKPYFSEKEVTDQLIEEAYERMKYEVDVSHILIMVSPDASPADTIRAFQKINEIWQKALTSENFDSLAVQYSEEPMIEATKGRLGYFTALQMVYPFENAAYSTPIGEISKPFRTQFGYHILKVHDKRPSHGKVNVSHIMLRFKPSMSLEDSIQIRNRIFEIYDQLASGYDWNTLCKEVSEDPNSKEKGGSLSPFGVGEMIPEIVEAAFSLSKIGEISDPVMTQYGWHIIKLNGITPLPAFEDYKEQLSRRIQRDTRSNKSKEALIKRLKTENGFSENNTLKISLLNQVDSSALSGDWSLGPEINGNETVFSLTDSLYRVKAFVTFVNKNRSKAGTGDPEVKINRLYNLFIEEKLVAYEKAHLEEKYEDYRYLLKEYREGILLFDIMEKEVWDKSGQDSIGIKEFYDNNLDNYTVNENASLITFELDKGIEIQSFIDSLLLIASDTSLSLDDVKERVIQEYSKISIKDFGKYSPEDDVWGEWIRNGPGIYNIGTPEKKEVALVSEYYPRKVSDMEKIKGLVISDYQDFLDKKWIESLRNKHKVEINKSELKKIYKSFVR